MNSGWLELSFDEGSQQIDDCENLFADEIRELEELTLGLIISEAKPQAAIAEPRDDSAWEKLLVGARPIETDSTCRRFRLIFDRNSMVLWTVLNESYGKYPKAPENFSGRLFRVFGSSHLLEFTRQTTIASDEYPGPLLHYEVACLNHVIDVICTKPPKVYLQRDKEI